MSVPRVISERLADLLKEYSEKLRITTVALLECEERLLSRISYVSHAQIAWLLDSVDGIQKPLRLIMEEASAFLEGGQIDNQLATEYSLRLAEIRTQLHHTLSCSHTISEHLKKSRMFEVVTKFRFSAGLSAMKGGPLRPAS